MSDLLGVGLRVHLGWADAITLVGVPDDPHVVDRRRLDMAAIGSAAFPFHAALKAAPEDREAVIAAGMEAAELAATDALAHLTSELQIDTGGVVVSRGVLRIPIDRILASSSLFHTAEGAVYQQALLNAFDNLGLPALSVEFAEAEQHELWESVSPLGKPLGPPWRKDQKFAAVAAWLAIARVSVP